MESPDTGPDLEAELESLYEVAPDRFVAARDDLVRRLRAAKRREDAAAVKGLRRPTVAAWALNQLPRTRGDDVRRLIEEGDEVRRVQQELLAGGDRNRLRDATTARRATRDALVDAALAALAGHPRTSPEAHRDDVLDTLEAASLDPDAGATLLRGRLDSALAPSSGFDLLAGPSGPPADGPVAEAATRQPEAGPASAVETTAHRARLEEARQVAADARALADQRRAEVGAAEEAAAGARRAAREAAEEVERLAAELERARRSAGRAASAAQDAAARVADAERVAVRSEAQAVTAEAALARLAGD